jgi:hypothetical protein
MSVVLLNVFLFSDSLQGTCSSSVAAGVCDGCRSGSSGYCKDTLGYCYPLNDVMDILNYVSFCLVVLSYLCAIICVQDGTCSAGDACDSGWPCLCETSVTENVHFVGFNYIFPVPTPAPTVQPSHNPTYHPTVLPTSEPTPGLLFLQKKSMSPLCSL